MQPQDKSKVTINPESLIPRKRKKLSTFACVSWAMIGLMVLGIVLLFVFKFDIGRLRGSAHFVRQARTAVDAQDWPAALSAIQKVDGDARELPEFLRTVADFLIGTRSDPATLAQLLEKLHATGDARPDDAIWLASAYLANGRTLPARAALDKVPPTARKSLPFLDTELTLLQQEGRTSEARKAENILFATFANDPRVAVRKAARDLVGTFPEIKEAALTRLWESSKRSDESGLAAIRVLSAYQGLTGPQAAQLKQLAAKHPDVTLRDQLDISTALIRLDPGRRQTILAEEIERSKDAGGSLFQELIAWLAREKAFDKVLQLVPREDLVKSADLFPALAHDLAEREQWEDLMQLLGKDRSLPVSNARAAGWRALATKNLHPEDARAARFHLEEALTESLAKNDTEALGTAVALAEQWDMLDLALQTSLKLAVPGSPNEASLLESCWRLAFHAKDEEALVEIASRLAGLKPGNLLLNRRHDYLLLLRGEAIETAGMAADSTPQSANQADLLLLALKAYRLGNLKGAADMVGKIQDTTDMTNGQHAVYAGLLAKTRGEIERAYRISEAVFPQLLLTNERLFWQMAR